MNICRPRFRLRNAPVQTPRLPALALPWDPAGSLSRITLCGSRRALIENPAAVIRLTEEEVYLRLKSGGITLWGEGLSLQEVRPDALLVEGRIRRLELEGEGS